MSRRQRFQFDREQLRITRGAAIILFLVVGVTLVWTFLDDPVKARLVPWIIPTADAVWRQGHVWALVTGVLLEPDILALVLQGLMLWLFVPALERWWGTPRFLRFAVITALVGSLAGSLAGLALPSQPPMIGLDGFIWASVIAFGIIHARQHVQFFGAIPLTGRQLMYGMIGFVALFVVLQGLWARGAGYAAAMATAAVLTSRTWNPGVALARWRKRRERAHLSVLVGGKAPDPKKKKEQWLN